jgi:hypothetical protein
LAADSSATRTCSLAVASATTRTCSRAAARTASVTSPPSPTCP